LKVIIQLIREQNRSLHVEYVDWTMAEYRSFGQQLLCLSLTATFVFNKPNTYSESDQFKFTSHLNTLRIYLVQYIWHIHSQINHMALSIIIRTCPKSVKNSTIMSNTACSITPTFWLLIFIFHFFWQLIKILVILPKWRNIFRTQKLTAIRAVGYFYRLWNYIRRIKRKFQKHENQYKCSHLQNLTI
jgi:hypothetical protein